MIIISSLQMVIDDVVQDDNCNSCAVHYNLSKVSCILPLISIDDAVDFFVQLCSFLTDQEKHNVWSILQTAESRYFRQDVPRDRDRLAVHKLHVVLQWFRSQEIKNAQRLTFILRALSYVDQKVLILLRDFLVPYSEWTNEDEFKPDITHCPWSGQWPCFTEKSGCVDFISKLPVTVSKLILSFVGVTNIWGARLVSQRWYMIIKEVLREHKQFQAHVFRCRALRPAMRNVNPTFANKVALCFTSGVCTTGHPYVSEEEPGSTKVILEERNVYCAAYHVQNLYRFQDPHRKIHYCRGKYFAVGSNDRRINIRSMETGKLHKTIVGHAGSIQSLLLIEKLRIVISGSYDLTIRAWSIETGAYLRLWRGHRGTITCLDHNDTLLISGARDSMVKVWYLKKAMIKRTFHHPRPITSVRLLGDRAAVGTESYHLFLWDVNQGSKLRVFNTVGTVYCVNITPHFIMGGANNVMYIWNMISLDESPMFTLPHPGKVLSVQYCYVRCITGCEDGKVRVWSLVSGDCIKVIRANAKGDSITTLFVDIDRLVINTCSTVISLDFIPTTWDYCSQRFLEEKRHNTEESGGGSRTLKRRCKSAVQLKSHIKNTTNNHSSGSAQWAIRRPIELTQSISKTMSETTDLGPPLVPPSSPEPPLEESPDISLESPGVSPVSPGVPPVSPKDPENIRTSVVQAATKQLLFEDVFNRGPISYCGLVSRPDVEILNTDKSASIGQRESGQPQYSDYLRRGQHNSEQLKKMKSKRPSSAPFVSASLSVHGHLPSFAKRRPDTASLIQHRVDVRPVERWQSSWQRLLSDIPETGDIGSVDNATRNKTKYGVQLNNSNCHPTTGGTVRRPKTATARIRY
ncbi:hypothetical protein ACHWQZ_G017674 [Mnemiopsis leidyi]